jgi:hypothetical protein
VLEREKLKIKEVINYEVNFFIYVASGRNLARGPFLGSRQFLFFLPTPPNKNTLLFSSRHTIFEKVYPFDCNINWHSAY